MSKPAPRFKTATAREAWSCNGCRKIIRPGHKITRGYGLVLCTICARGTVARDVQRFKRARKRTVRLN